MHELVRKLIEIQEDEKLSDRGFAPKLGLSNGLWSGVKAGDRTMGRKALNEIERRYPQLTSLINDYWLNSRHIDEGSSAESIQAAI